MNWLDPKEVEAWLDDHENYRPEESIRKYEQEDVAEALERFVRALAALDERPIDNLTPVIRLARLLAGAMEERYKP